MKKLYLLLRNNKQTGPFSFNELVQQQLKDADLVWVEGESHAWTYPSEIDGLKPVAAPIVKQNNKQGYSRPSSISVILPAPSQNAPAITFEQENKFEKRREELQKKLPLSPLVPTEALLTNEPGFLDTIEPAEKEIFVTYHKRKKDLGLGQVAIAGMVVIFLGVTVYKNWPLFRERNSVDSVATQILKSEQSSEAKVTTVIAAPDAANQQFVAEPEKNKPKEPVLKKTKLSRFKKQFKIPQPENISLKNDENLIPALVQVPLEIKDKKEIVAGPENSATDKKKSIGQMFKGLFKKKKKETATEIKSDNLQNE